MVVPPRRKGRQGGLVKLSPQTTEARLLLLFVIVCLGFGSASWWRLQNLSGSGPHFHRSAHNLRSHSVARSLRAEAQEDQQMVATPESTPTPTVAWEVHSILVFDGATQLSDAELGLDVYKAYPKTFSIVRFNQASAAALMSVYDLTSVPAVVYVPPAFVHGKAHVVYDPALSGDTFQKWMQQTARVYLMLGNDSKRQVCFYMLEAEAKERMLSCLPPRQRTWQSNTVLDQIIARYDDDKALAGNFTVLQQGAFVVRNPEDCAYMLDPDNCKLPFDPFPTDPGILARRKAMEQQRLDTMTQNPPRFKKYTKVGFEKRKCPVDVWRSLQSYLRLNNGSVVREDWDLGNAYTYANIFDAAMLRLPLPEYASYSNPMRQRVEETVREILEEWGGGVALTPTALYGVRVYSRGCSLLDHVDNPGTHVMSAIINVDQDVEEPWPLEIYSHDGVVHQVTMEPGDMVLYEGSVCTHGRPQPLKGRWYSNTFVHFKPTNVA